MPFIALGLNPQTGKLVLAGLSDTQTKCNAKLSRLNNDCIHRKTFNLADLAGIHKWLMACGIELVEATRLMQEVIEALKQVVTK